MSFTTFLEQPRKGRYPPVNGRAIATRVGDRACACVSALNFKLLNHGIPYKKARCDFSDRLRCAAKLNTRFALGTS